MEHTENTGHNGRVRKRIGETLPVLYLETYVIAMAGGLLGGILTVLIGGSRLSPDGGYVFWDAWYTGAMYAQSGGIWIAVLLFVGLSRRRRPMLKALGTKAEGNNWKNLLLGLLMGFGLNGICILAAYLHKDIALQFEGFRPLSFVMIFLMIFVQSSAEEALCRWFLYQMILKGSRRPVYAIVANSLFFSVLHLFNDGVTVLSLINITAIGILFSLIVYYMDSLWCAFAVHAAWNFTQNILFGLPNSGIVLPYSLFKLDAASAADSFAYNVAFGIEGTILANLVLIAACLLMYLWGRKYGKTPCDVWGQEEGQNAEAAK